MAKCRGCNGDGTVWESGHIIICPMCEGTGDSPDPLPPPPKPKKKKQ